MQTVPVSGAPFIGAGLPVCQSEGSAELDRMPDYHNDPGTYYYMFNSVKWIRKQSVGGSQNKAVWTDTGNEAS